MPKKKENDTSNSDAKTRNRKGLFVIPTHAMDDDGKPVKDDDGKPVINDSTVLVSREDTYPGQSKLPDSYSEYVPEWGTYGVIIPSEMVALVKALLRSPQAQKKIKRV